jgi:uncharacterized HAD superfamily protein
MSQAKKIGVDLDDVLLAIVAGLFPWHNRLYGTNNSEKDVRPFELSSSWNCTKEEAVSRILAFYQTPEHAECMPVPGAIEAMEALGKKHQLVIVTSKPANLEVMTHAWVEKHFPKTFQGIYFTNAFVTPEHKQVKKSELCHDLGIEIFIDDSIGNVIDVATACEQVFLFDRPWNQDKVALPANVTRAYSWKEIIDFMNTSAIV